MKLNCETILDFYTFKRKKFLCQIKVNPKSQKFKSTCRCLSQEQWAIFDKKLEKFLTASNKLDENGYRFNLNPLIEVKVQKSKLSFKYFYELFDTIGEFNKSDAIDVTEKDLILECLIDFQQEVPSSSSVATQEYEPKVSTAPNAMICNPIPYQPYTPSKKRLEESNDINYIQSNEDTYSPKPLLDESVCDPHFDNLIPQYTPAPISDRRKSNENKKLDVLKKTADGKNSLVIQSKQHKRVECEYIPESQDVTSRNAPIYIPTPIEEITQKLCNIDNIRTFRKRSNTIDVFSELISENEIDGNSKYLPRKSFKKRSMTIDEIPAELFDIPVYIPSSSKEKASQRVAKVGPIKESEEHKSSKHKQFYENVKVPTVFANHSSCTMTNIINSTTAVPNYEGENSASTINEVEAAVTRFNVIQKSKENKPFLASVQGEPPYDGRDLRNPDAYTDRVFKTTVGKRSSSKKKLNNSQAKSLSNESQSVVKNLEKLRETQRKENTIKPEVYNRSDKYIKEKRSLDHLSTKDEHSQIRLKRGNKIENHGTKVLKRFRRSKRSPNKLDELIDDQGDYLNKTDSKKHKSLLKNKELFGTDDEDDEDSPCETPASKNHSSSLKNKKHQKR